MPTNTDRVRTFAKFAGRFTALDVAKAINLRNSEQAAAILKAIPAIRVVDARKTGYHQCYTYEWVGP